MDPILPAGTPCWSQWLSNDCNQRAPVLSAHTSRVCLSNLAASVSRRLRPGGSTAEDGALDQELVTCMATPAKISSRELLCRHGFLWLLKALDSGILPEHTQALLARLAAYETQSLKPTPIHRAKPVSVPLTLLKYTQRQELAG